MTGQRLLPMTARQQLEELKQHGGLKKTVDFVLKFQQLYAQLTPETEPDLYTVQQVLRRNLLPQVRDLMFPRRTGGPYESLQDLLNTLCHEGQQWELNQQLNFDAGSGKTGSGKRGPPAGDEGSRPTNKKGKSEGGVLGGTAGRGLTPNKSKDPARP